jgi:hypothetical protein
MDDDYSKLPDVSHIANDYDALPDSSGFEKVLGGAEQFIKKTKDIPGVGPYEYHKGAALLGGVGELTKGVGAATELFSPETGKAITKAGRQLTETAERLSPSAYVGEFGSYAVPYTGATKGMQLLRGGQEAASLLGKTAEAAAAGGLIGGITTPGEPTDRLTSAAIGTALGGVTPGVSRLVQEGINLVKKGMSSTAENISAQLKQYGQAGAAKVIDDAIAKLSGAQKELQVTQKPLEQLSRQEDIAKERATRGRFSMERETRGKPEEEFAQRIAEIRQNVSTRARQASVEARQKAQAAGASEQEAIQFAQNAEQEVLQAQQGIEALERDLAARKGISKEEFGRRIAKIADDIELRGGENRKKIANIQSVIENAGNFLRVPTSTIKDIINQELRGIRNPTLQNQLERINNQIYTFGKDGKPISALTVRSADSLKDFINGEIKVAAQKENGKAVKVLTRLKEELLSTIDKTYPPYRQALDRYRVISRSLDIVERNGALAKVVDRDPVNLQRKLTEAEVASHVIDRANRGDKVMLRLAGEDPSFKEAARLHYVQDLFGQDHAPSIAELRTWLGNNELSLRGLGLYNEFGNIQIARKTAQEALDIAKGVKAEAGRAKEVATRGREAAKAELAEAKRVSKAGKGRLEEALKTITPAEKLAKEATERAAPAKKAFEERAGAAAKTVEQETKLKEEYESLAKDIERMDLKDIPQKVRKVAEDLRQRQLITVDEEQAIKDQVAQAEKEFKTRDQARKLLQKIAIGIGISGSLISGEEQLRKYIGAQ